MTEPGLWFAAGAGGALGAVLRGSVYRLIAVHLMRRDSDQPRRLGVARATLLVNLTGSFLLGFGAALLPHLSANGSMRVFWLTGFCGSLTTFSTFCADAVRLARARDQVLLIGYLLANGLLSVVSFSGGSRIAGFFTG